MGEGLFTNVARVALSCTCSARIIHEGLLEKDINRGLVSFQSQHKFSFEILVSNVYRNEVINDLRRFLPM